jgi:hypothetical protein
MVSCMCSYAVAVGGVPAPLPPLLLLQPNTTAHSIPCATPSRIRLDTHLQHLQLYVSPRQKLLDFTRVGFGNVLAEGVLGATDGVLAEVVCGKLVSLAQELAVLCREPLAWCILQRRIVVSQDDFVGQDGSCSFGIN